MNLGSGADGVSLSRAQSTVLLLAMLSVPALASGFIDVKGCTIATRRIDGVEFVSLRRVVRAAAARIWIVGERFIVLYADSLRPQTESLSAPPREWECVFAAGESVAVCNGRRLALGAACRLADAGRDLLVPALAVAGLFPSTELPRLRTVETLQRGDTTIVRLGFSPGSRGHFARADPVLVVAGAAASSLEFRLGLVAICDSAVDAQLRLLSLTSGSGLLRQVNRESSAATSLLFTFRQPAVETVKVRHNSVEVWAWPKPARRVSRILLDPGHGGHDPGAVGRMGTQEKVIALDIAKRVKRRLEAQGLQLSLTRESDTFVSLAERVRRANRTGFDLLVSIHTNAAPNRKACGLETYFLSEAKTDWERAVAARENAAFEREVAECIYTGDQLGLILADLAQNEFLFESSEMAAQIHEAILRVARMNDRGVRQAGFYVLRGSFMPAVLVECGFVSNRSEEKLLRRPEFREKLAKGIAEGCMAFVRDYERRLNGHRP